jgi:hypothetical protein
MRASSPPLSRNALDERRTGADGSTSGSIGGRLPGGGRVLVVRGRLSGISPRMPTFFRGRAPARFCPRARRRDLGPVTAIRL